MHNLIIVCIRSKRFAEAKVMADRRLQLNRSSKDLANEAFTLKLSSDIENNLGHRDQSLSLMAESVKACARMGKPAQTNFLLMQTKLAGAYYNNGKLADAEVVLVKVLDATSTDRKLRRGFVAIAPLILAKAYSRTKRKDEALALLRENLAWADSEFGAKQPAVQNAHRLYEDLSASSNRQ